MQHGNEQEQQDVLGKCVSAEPAHGSLWCAVSKARGERNPAKADVLRRVAQRIVEEKNAPSFA